MELINPNPINVINKVNEHNEKVRTLNDINKSFGQSVYYLADASPDEIMGWVASHPNEAQNYSSYIDTLIEQAYARQNYDYQYAKEHDAVYMMDQLRKAGINPTLAFRNLSTGSSASVGSVSSNYSSELSRKASLEEQKANNATQHEEFIATLFKTIGIALLGGLIALI